MINFNSLIYSLNVKFLLGIFFVFSAFSFAQTNNDTKEVSKTVYSTANIGVKRTSNTDAILRAIVEASKKEDSSIFIALGNSTRKNGYPKNKKERAKEETFLKDKVLEPLSDFNGQIIFIPGKNSWNEQGQDALDDLESFLQDNSTAEFWPNDGCPIERESLSDEVELVMVDTQWYLENWDDHPYINNKCEIKTRDQFFLAFKDELKDEQNKTIIVALHHPVLTANRKGFFGRMGGFSNQDYFQNDMQYLVGSLKSYAEQFEDVIFIAGNHKNLQFLSDDGVPQIISGASGDIEHTKKTSKSIFRADTPGFSKLTVFKDGSSQVEFFSVDGSKVTEIYSTEIKSKKGHADDFAYHTSDDFGSTYDSSIYTEEETDKSGIYKWFWGDHYRDVYSKKITAPVLFLDSLPHNVRAITEGGGNQSRSLRLIDDNEHEFTVRELRKSATRFIQSKIRDHYVLDYMDNTLAEDVIMDYYTTAQPYAQFAINDLLKAIEIPHAEPKIVYLPKQERLGRFNESYGDKLYMIEEHVGDENKDFDIFGNPEDIISTSDVLLELQDDKDARIDESMYLRARLFDMLVGDWDRHEDQWRWALHETEDGRELYKPIPRDRDQAFPKYDGIFPAILKLGSPLARNMQSYAPEIQNIKTFNNAVFYLDKTLINRASWNDWKIEAENLQKMLTDEVIDNAFAGLLEDTKDESTETILRILKLRRDNMLNIAKDYYDYYKEHEIIVAINKDNTIDIVRKPNGVTHVKIMQDEHLILENNYNKNETSELWIYALDGDDEIKVSGKGSDYIKLKIFGGEENDVYDIENNSRLKVYDYKTKKNTFNGHVRKYLSDSYDINNYDPKKRKYTENVILPTVGFDRDAGLNFGIANTFTTYDLLRNPFSTQHTLSARYFSATEGLEFSYYGEFAHVFYNWNLGIDARVTTDKYATNFFGIGNETVYDDDAVDIDYNRTKIGQWHFEPSLIYTTGGNVTAHIAARVESNEVYNKDNGFIEDYFEDSNDVFERQIYAGGEVGVNFNNKRGLISYPRRGMEFGVDAGYLQTTDKTYDNKFGYVRPTASFIYPIHESGAATIATKAQANFILGDNYEFYHAATVGGNRSLRGYRNYRFTGQTSFFQTTDLRVGILNLKSAYVPLRIGVTAGYDLGRVWNDNEDSNKWHNSYGGSVFINGFQVITANIGYYVSEEDARIMFTAGFRF